MSKHQGILLLMGNNEMEAKRWLQGLYCTGPERGGRWVLRTGHRRWLASTYGELARGGNGRSIEHRFYGLTRGQFSKVIHDVPIGIRKRRLSGRIRRSTNSAYVPSAPPFAGRGISVVEMESMVWENRSLPRSETWRYTRIIPRQSVTVRTLP